jgi:hypothetical protein
MIIRPLLLSCCALALSASDSTWSLEPQASFLFGTGDMRRLREDKNPAGYTLGGALRYQSSADFSLRLHANLFSMRGKIGSGLENDAPIRSFYGLDVARDAGRWSVYGGLVGVQWKQARREATLKEFSDFVGSTYYNNSSKGLKMGFRVGVDYALTDEVRATVSFTQTEFNKLYQPSWLAVGMVYRFKL